MGFGLFNLGFLRPLLISTHRHLEGRIAVWSRSVSWTTLSVSPLLGRIGRRTIWTICKEVIVNDLHANFNLVNSSSSSWALVWFLTALTRRRNKTWNPNASKIRINNTSLNNDNFRSHRSLNDVFLGRWTRLLYLLIISDTLHFTFKQTCFPPFFNYVGVI